MSVILFFTYMLNMFTNVPFLIKLCDLLGLPLKGQEYVFKIQINIEKNHKIPKVFFRRSNKFLSISSGIDDLGEPKYELALGLLFAWILCFLCLLKGIKTTGKVMGSWFSI